LISTSMYGVKGMGLDPLEPAKVYANQW